MRYELRINGRTFGFFDRYEQALDQVRLALACDADAEPEVLDTRTGRAVDVDPLA
jgi:hypothetical protein